MKRITLILAILFTGFISFSQIVEDEIEEQQEEEQQIEEQQIEEQQEEEWQEEEQQNKEQKKEEHKRNDEIKTLLGRSSSIGGYGGLSVLYSQIDAKDAFVFGARGAVIMDHVFALGIGGAGFVNDFHYDYLEDKNMSLAGGYGGLFFEPIVFPKFPVHISIPVLVGVGGIALTSMESNDWEDEYFVEDAVSFLVVEPGVEIEMNITRYFRFSLGGYYRYTSEIDLMDTESDVLNGFSFGVNFKFGKF